MKHIPQEIKAPFDAILIEKAIPRESHFHYRKWLRYYLDYSIKYSHLQTNKESLTLFVEKLKDKKQTAGQQEQASRAISLYYELVSSQSGKRKPYKNKNDRLSSEKNRLKATGADWRQIYDDLDSEIKLRLYSPKTLRAYRGC